MNIRRRSSRKLRKINSKLMAIILIIVVFVCSTGYAYFSQNLSLTGTAKLSGDNPYCKLDLFKGYKDFEVSYDYIYYMNHQEILDGPLANPNNENVDVRVTITIKNIGTKTVTAWRSFSIFPTTTNVTNFWNASAVYEGAAKTGKLLIYEYPSIYWNNTMEPGQTITFNVDYSTSDTIVEIQETSIYGWDISTENVPELEDMASCIYDGNSSGGDSGETGGDFGETGGDSGETGGDSGETGGDSGETGGDSGETGGDSGETGGDSGETGGDSGETGGDTVTSPDGKIIASVENRYQQDDNGLSYYATVITLTNNTDTNINNWYIKLDVGEGGAIPGCWTAKCEQAEGIITITPPAWGVNLEPKNPYVIEFQTSTKQVEPKVIETGILE